MTKNRNFNYSDEEWQQIEERVLFNIPVGKVKDFEDFKQQMLSTFFHGKEFSELTRGQRDFGNVLWERLADEYDEGYQEKHPNLLRISLKQYPDASKRFFRSLRVYPNVLKYFEKGYSRGDVVRHFQQQTGRKYSSINRDISAFAKIGIIKKRPKKRGYYDVEPNVYV